MCFAPQRRPLFRHLNVQKRSENGVLLTFWLRNVLRATRACTCLTSQFPKVVRTPGAFNILTSKCASRHNGVQFVISYLASWLRIRRFSEPTLWPSAATNHWKDTMNRDFSAFSRTCIFFLLTLSLLWSFLFCSSPLWLFSPLAFPSVHIVGSLTSKFPSATVKRVSQSGSRSSLSPPWLMACMLELLDQHQHRVTEQSTVTNNRRANDMFMSPLKRMSSNCFKTWRELTRVRSFWLRVPSCFLSARLCVNMYSIDLNCSGSRGRACTVFLSFLQ